MNMSKNMTKAQMRAAMISIGIFVLGLILLVANSSAGALLVFAGLIAMAGVFVTVTLYQYKSERDSHRK